jgi:hypothetical protein
MVRSPPIERSDHFATSSFADVSYLPRGVVQNILFENFYIEGAAIGGSISQNSGNNGVS